MVSLVIPFYNEEMVIKDIIAQIISTFSLITDDYEIICVDDGSTDRTLTELRELKLKEGRIKVVVLSRNFGHPAAFTAGMAFAKGEYIALMDGDLQDSPSHLKPMYDLLIKDCLLYTSPSPRDS